MRQAHKWAAAAGAMGMLVLVSGCSSSSSGGGGGSSSTAVGEVLEGTWIGYAKNISDETFTEDTAQLEGLQVNSSGEVTMIIDEGEWVSPPATITIDATEEDNVYKIDGEDFGEDEESDFIVVSSDGEHLTMFHLSDSDNYVKMAAYNLDSTATDTVPDDPSSAPGEGPFVGTWSGTAIDVEVNSPPSLGAVNHDATMMFSSANPNLAIDSGQTFGGHDLDLDEPPDLIRPSGTDANYAFFRGDASYAYWLIPSPDLAIIAFVFCAPTAMDGLNLAEECGDGAGAEIDLPAGLNGQTGWIFSLLEPPAEE